MKKVPFNLEKSVMAMQNHTLKVQLLAHAEQFMQYFQISEIGYSFLFRNGRRIIIESSQSFIEDYSLLNQAEEVEDLEFYYHAFSKTPNDKIYSKIWAVPPKTTVFGLLEKYSIAKCIGFYRRIPAGLEAIHLANYVSNLHVFYNNYINHINLFHQFIFHLSSQLQSILQKTEIQTFNMYPVTECSTYELLPEYNVNKDADITQTFSSNLCQELLHLSKREYECLRLLAMGHTSKTIANELRISARTAETYLNHLREKTFTHNKFALIRYALEHRHLFNI